MAVTLEKFRKILDELEISHRIHSEIKMFEFITGITEPYNISLKFLYSVHEDKNQIQAHGILCTYDLDDRNNFDAALRFCNQWNHDMVEPKICVVEEQKLIMCEWTWDTEMELSDDIIKEMIVARFVQSTRICTEMAIQDGLYPDIQPVPAKRGKP